MKKTVLCAILSSGLALCGSAMAQDAGKGFYLGAGIGQSKLKDACTDLPSGLGRPRESRK